MGTTGRRRRRTFECAHRGSEKLSMTVVQRRQLSKHRLSDNVVPVKYFLGVLTRALRGACHFALVEAVPYQPKARSQSVSGQELSPTHASLRSTTSIMITTSNSPVQRERDTQSITRCSTSHHRLVRVVPRAN